MTQLKKQIEDLTFKRKKQKLMKRISRLQVLMEVSRGYPAWLKYDVEMDDKLTELSDLIIVPSKSENEQKLMIKN